MLTPEQSSWVTPCGLSMNIRTIGLFSGPATSACTSSRPWSIATCSANARTLSAIDSLPNATLLKELAPKEKVGETHRTRTRAFEQAVNYTETPGFKQTRLRRSQLLFYNLADELPIGVFA